MNCPKCGTHINAFDIRPNCKNCGVNIFYYTQEEQLVRDAKRAELEFASARIVVAKIKAAFIAGKLQIARIVALVLCIAALLVPFAAITYSVPMAETKFSVSGLGAYSLYSDGLLMKLPDFAKSTLFGSSAKGAIALYALLVVLALLVVAQFVTELLSFLNIRKTAKAMCGIAVSQAAVCAAMFICSLVLKGGASFVSVKTGAGAFVNIAAAAVYFVINYLIFKKDIPLGLRDNDLLRKETLKKLKAGEINIDDLSLPVYETEQEKEERLKALAEALKKEEEGKE